MKNSFEPPPSGSREADERRLAEERLVNGIGKLGACLNAPLDLTLQAAQIDMSRKLAGCVHAAVEKKRAHL